MKIYNKTSFVAGVICAGALPLYAFGILKADWWHWLISIACAGKLLHIGLTESGSRRAAKQAKYDSTVGTSLFGKHYKLKSNLPWILTIGFLGIALILRLFQIWLPVWLYVLFVVALAAAAAYSIGVNKQIEDYIDTAIPDEEGNSQE